MPHQAMIINAIPIEIGIDINTKKVARKFIKNSANTIQMKINSNFMKPVHGDLQDFQSQYVQALKYKRLALVMHQNNFLEY